MSSSQPRLELGKEYPLPDEPQHTDEVRRLFSDMTERKYPPGVRPMRRDAHTKAHGLLRAEFTVMPGLPEKAAVGLFARPASYEAWVRFSNAFSSIADDTAIDVRGMALKVMGVPGEKLLENERHEQTQDFLLINHNVFFSPNTREYLEFTREYVKQERAVSYVLRPGRWRQAFILYRAGTHRVGNPLCSRYWSSVPFAHGRAAVKYSARPAGANAHDVKPGKTPNFLRQTMVAYLRDQEATFDFMVQFQTHPERMPVEDPSVEWSERESPFITVARVTIPPQTFDTDAQNTYAENLSFTPWHSLPEHRPIGGVNRIRKTVYEHISTLRHNANGVPRQEPRGFADFKDAGTP